MIGKRVSTMALTFKALAERMHLTITRFLQNYNNKEKENIWTSVFRPLTLDTNQKEFEKK